jgi:hypothetical protein
MLMKWPLDEPIDQLIGRVRVYRGASQYTLADALRAASGNPSVDRSYINRWERRRRIPTPYWRRYLSVVLEIPLPVLDRAAANARMRREEQPLVRSPDTRLPEREPAVPARHGLLGDPYHELRQIKISKTSKTSKNGNSSG